MPVFFLGGPKVQYFDSNGDVLSGGKVYSYEVGTTTNKATYPTIADAKAGTNANANPVVLDSRGEADIVLAGSTKLKLTDGAASETTIWTLDNVNGDSDFLDANGDEILVFSEASSPVNHLQITNAATGAAPKLSGVGDDANVSIEIEAKAAGDIVLDPGTSGDVVIEAGSIKIDTTEGILDGGGDEYLLFTETSTPVNYLNITNANTSNDPKLESAGSDTNVGMTIDTKGTGALTLGSQDMQVKSDADTVDLQTGGSSRLDLNDSGMRLGAANSRVTTILDEDAMGSDSATALATQQSIKAYHDNAIASQAEMETASSTTQLVSAGRAQYHPGVSKAWVKFTSITTTAIEASYNITSVTDNGTGDTTVTIATDFSGADYCAAGQTGNEDATGYVLVGPQQAVTAGTFRVISATTGGTATDNSYSSICFFGDQ
jgi:hypothetical protein